MRLTALVAACVLVLAIGVYLFIQVHASPASADSGHRGHHGKVSAADEEPESPPEEDPATTPTPSGGHRSAAVALPHPSLTAGEAGSGGVAMADPNVRHATVGLHAADHVATPKMDARMLEASKAYDRGDTDEARDLAKAIIAEQPGNVRMLRILVSTACLDGDAASAKQYYATLPKSDQAQMRTRCERYGVTFDNPAP